MKSDYAKLPPECDPLCEWRQCLHRGEDKGPYSPGRGYTSYYDKPKYVCMNRMIHGCPYYGGSRSVPDMRQVLRDLEDKIYATKTTMKVRDLLLRQLNVFRAYVKLIEQRNEYELNELIKERRELELSDLNNEN